MAQNCSSTPPTGTSESTKCAKRKKFDVTETEMATDNNKDDFEDLGRLFRAHGLGNGMSTDVIRAIRGKRVFCGAARAEGSEDDGGGGVRNFIMLVTEEGQVRLLNRQEEYA